MKASKCCTKFGMVQVHSEYSGVSTIYLTTYSDFKKASLLFSRHEDVYVVGRNDINLLLSKKVARKEISPELSNTFVWNAKHRFTSEQLRKHTQGATFVKFGDMIAIHLFESSKQQNTHIINECRIRGSRQSEHAWVKRSRSLRINLLQNEYCKGFGTQFRPIL